ncbi:hypothetical protein EV175_006334 [Coemansia sp. RSA 1933]|nr:hypothetical protein EV175_006334 [Coemansia sp. RSA 1933]
MTGVQTLASVYATTEGGDIVWTARASTLDALEDSWVRSQSKDLATAVATLFLNLPIAAVRRNDDDAGLTVLSAASRFLDVTTTADAQLRLNVFGVLSSKLQLCKDSARILGDTTTVILGINGGSGAAKLAAQQAGAFLSA